MLVNNLAERVVVITEISLKYIYNRVLSLNTSAYSYINSFTITNNSYLNYVLKSCKIKYTQLLKTTTLLVTQTTAEYIYILVLSYTSFVPRALFK